MFKSLAPILILMSLCGLAQAQIPSSARSEEVITRVAPKLEQELEQAGLRLGLPIYLRIFKESKELEVWMQAQDSFHLCKTYRIHTYGWRGLGPKLKQGDGKAPEGFYFVKPIQLNPSSTFHLSFNLGYPNAYDRAHGRTGSALMVHGDKVSIGCYAMTDPSIEEIYTLAEAALRQGQPFFRVHIFPFRMTDENMERHRESNWREFWENLREGYDYFEDHGFQPPNVEVENGKYIFEED